MSGGDSYPTLTTTRLILRPWRDDDLESLAAMNADPRVMEYFPATLTREESVAMLARLRADFDRRGYGKWALEAPGVTGFVGMTGLAPPPFESHFTPCVEIGWRLLPEYWRRGYATEAARAALAFGFETLALAEVVAFTVPANGPSRRVMERIGMTRSPDDDFDHPTPRSATPSAAACCTG